MSRERKEGVNLFSSMYEMDLMPGLALRQGPVCSLDIGLSTPFRTGELSIFMSARNLVGFSSLFLKGGFRFTLAGGNTGYHASLGLESRAGLSALSDTGFTLIEDGAVYASSELLLGWMGGFSVGGAWSVGYEHIPLPSMYWRVGLETSSLSGYRPSLLVSGGVFL